jgi:eukaryotic-like serine/threonine-protein kinase
VEQLDGAALAIVEDCLALPEGPPRETLIETRTAGNPALRARVTHLLAQGDGDLGRFATQTFVSPSALARPLPERAGPFRITGVIAEGGMGSVARGERDDGVYVQTVAVKFIRGDLSGAAARERFDEERRILASLSHPSIAHVLDGGSQDGWPWLAMEYVDGEPLTDALDQAGADLQARLEALFAVCDAVAFAHRNLVIHADIKPGNVLMRRDGAIKLLDFGIARLAAEADPDEPLAAHPLTPAYAAPERASGGAPTIAGDIFGLGMLLRDVLGEQSDADTAAIVAHATAADPAERYADVPALIADLWAYRDHRPVAARRDAGWRYRAGKFLRRHRLGASVTAAVMAILAIAAVTATVLYVRAEQARTEAERRFTEVRELSRFLLFDLYDDLADSPGTLPSRLRLADTARRYLDQLQRVPDAPADLRLDIARGWRRLAMVEGLSGVSSLGRPDRARQALVRAEAETRALLADNPDHAGALEELGWIEVGRWTIEGDSAASEQTTARAAAAFARALALDPGREHAVLGLLTTRRNTGYELIWSDHPADAIPVLRGALNDLRRRRFGQASAREAFALEVGLLSQLGDAVYYAGDPPGSLVWYRQQDAVIRAELERQPSAAWTDKLGEAKFNLAGTLVDLPGRQDEALAEARAGAVAIERALSFGPDVNLERRLSVLYGQEALILGVMGRHDEAAAMSRRGFDIRLAVLAGAPGEPGHRRSVAVAGANHARVLAEAGAIDEACAAARIADREWIALRRSGDLWARDAENELAPVAEAIRRYCR